MSESIFYLMPNSNESQNFFEFIKQVDIPEDYKNEFLGKKIEKVKIDTSFEKGAWTIYIQDKNFIPKLYQEKIEDALALHNDISKVSFVFLQEKLTVEEYFKNNFKEIAKNFSNGDQSVLQLLLNACIDFNDKCLIIRTKGEFSANILSERGVAEKIKSYISERFNENFQVEFESKPEEYDDSYEDAFMTEEYLQALNSNPSVKTKSNSDNVILGKSLKNKTKTCTLEEVREESRDTVLEGMIISHEIRQLRSGRYILMFDLMDWTDGISAKVFFDKEELVNKVKDKLAKNMQVRVKGTVQFDKFANELILYADSIYQLQVEERLDTDEVKRVELHAHTRFSTLDAVISVKDLVKTAAKWGHSAIAITDHGVVQAFPEAYETAQKEKIKIIYGMEGYLFDDDINKAYHIVILAKDYVGLRNLYELVSLSHLEHFHRTPRIPRSALVEHKEGLILGSACEAGEIIQGILNEETEEKLLERAAFYDYLEIQPIYNNEFLIRKGLVANEEGLKDVNRKVCSLGERLNKPVVATCDVHFLNPEDEIFRRILMAGQGYEDANAQPPLYFRTTKEMLEEFKYLGEDKARELVIDNTRLISDMIDDLKPIPDELYSPKIANAEEEIKELAYSSAVRLYGEELPKIVQERLDYELSSIIDNGFAVLYLTAQKLVKKSMDDGYLVGSRGSVGSSFVATMTGITEVNPLIPHWRCPKCQYSEFITDGSYGSGFDLPDKDCPKCNVNMVKDGQDIPFAVFMGFHGDKVPDIDLNFSGEYQAQAHKYTEELFGRDNVFRAGTIATIAEKTAYGFARKYCEENSIIARNAFLNKLVSGCTGVKRTTGQHPGGLMVVPSDMNIHEFTPIQYPADDKNSSTITTHFDYHSISSRLVKLDLLGHDDPTVIKMLEDITGIDAKKIPFDDKATMSLFSSTEALGIKSEDINSTVGTFGVPEFGTRFVRQMLEETKPTKFSELVRISGFSHGTDVWIGNAQELIKNNVAKLSEAISARDDIMVYLIQNGIDRQLAFKVMEDVRKGKGIKYDDVEILQANNIPEWYIDSCQKIKYMFPKAHAAAYVMMAVRIAYCKVHYPLAFYASYFTVRADEFNTDFIMEEAKDIKEKISLYEQKGNTLTAKEKNDHTILEMVLEMRLRGFKMLKIDLYKSDATKFLIEGDSLRPPFVSLSGLGRGAAEIVVKEREKRPFSSIEDLRTRGKVSKPVIADLQAQGCLDDLDETDQISLFA